MERVRGNERSEERKGRSGVREKGEKLSGSQQFLTIIHFADCFRTLTVGEFHQIPQLILNQLRWLDHIVKGNVSQYL